MRDGIIKADGTSRLVRANLPATYEEFRAQAAAGTLPLDVLFNEAGWSQQPTFLNKANLLQDETAALFGLGAEAVPDEVFGLIQNQFGRQHGYGSDLFLYMTGRHPILNEWELSREIWTKRRHEIIQNALARTVSLTLTGDQETVTFTVYDGGDV